MQHYDDHQRRRLAVRPGLTRLAQANGRNALSWAEHIGYDVTYVLTQSMRDDLWIILATASTILSGTGTHGHLTDDLLATPGGDTPGFPEVDRAGHAGHADPIDGGE